MSSAYRRPYHDSHRDPHRRPQQYPHFRLEKLMLSIAMTVLIVAFVHCQEIPSEDGVAGPFASLAIVNAIVIDGTGEAPYGPVDLLIEENTITALEDSPSTFRLSAECVYDASNE